MGAHPPSGFEQFRKLSRRDEFLTILNTIVLWSDMYALIKPLYPKGMGGRPTIGLGRILRIDFVQH